MVAQQQVTAEEFAERLPDLPDGGRWIELVQGSVVHLGQPDLLHGTAVLNFSKALAAYLEAEPRPEHGYACFDLGIITVRQPDTVRFPAVSFFVEGPPFAETGKVITERAPAWVVEVASTGPRRERMAARVDEYHMAGVRVVWVVDTVEKTVHVARKGMLSKRFTLGDTVAAAPVLPRFRIFVDNLFAEPAWWK